MLEAGPISFHSVGQRVPLRVTIASTGDSLRLPLLVSFDLREKQKTGIAITMPVFYCANSRSIATPI
jgi:hypothetical protein